VYLVERSMEQLSLLMSVGGVQRGVQAAPPSRQWTSAGGDRGEVGRTGQDNRTDSQWPKGYTVAVCVLIMVVYCIHFQWNGCPTDDVAPPRLTRPLPLIERQGRPAPLSLLPRDSTCIRASACGAW